MFETDEFLAETSCRKIVSPKLQDMTDLLGQELVARLVARWGGVRLYVPHRFRGDHPLVDTLGEAACRKLMRHYCGETLNIPCKMYASSKKAAIIDGLFDGKPHRVIAREVEVSQRYVEKIASLLRDEC